MGSKRVVVVHDTSRELNWAAIRGVLHNLCLKVGDELILLGVVHQFNNSTTTSAFLGTVKLLGQRNKVDHKLVEEELAKRMEEYNKSLDMFVLLKQCEVQKVKFHIEVQAGNSRKVVAVIAIKRLDATWIILDREMKKEKRYFMEKLSCGISKLKSDNSIEDVRGPLTTILDNTTKQLSLSRRSSFSYDEMIPGDDDSSQDLHPPPQQNSKVISHVRTSSKEQPSSILGKSSSDSCENSVKRSSSSDQINSSTSSSSKEDEMNDRYLYGTVSFKNSVCSFCGNKRPKMRWHKDFSYKELEEATQGFSSDRFLSEGGFGSVYKGILKNGLTIAVKQHNDMSLQGDKEFKSEVEVLSKARHPNLVMLLGYCCEGSQRLLVYEYVCNGSLDQFLSAGKYFIIELHLDGLKWIVNKHVMSKSIQCLLESRCSIWSNNESKHLYMLNSCNVFAEDSVRMPLNWEKRMKVALGAARGLEYLHKHNIIHRDIRPNNILITHDHESLLGDFGLAKAGYDESQNSSSGNNVVGTLGYMAPEYAATGKFSTKTDVYAFGVVLLQLITGLKTTDKYFEETSLVEWAMPLLEQRNYPSLIDKRIGDSFDFHQLFWMVKLAGKCLEKDPNNRHTMELVAKTLSDLIDGNTDNSLDLNPIENSSSYVYIAKDYINNNSKQVDVKGNEDIILATEASSKRWSPSSSKSHEGCESRKIGLKHKGPSSNKGRLLYGEMIH